MSPKNHSISHYLYPWIVWGLAASFFFYKYFIQVSPGVMSTQLMETYSLSGAGLGHLAACFFYAYLIMQIPAGLLLDRYSPRLILLWAIFLCAFGTLIFARTNSLFMAELSRFLIGLTAAFAGISCFKLATLWFPPKRFALVAGLSMTIAMIGAVCGEAPLSYLMKHSSWRRALEITALSGFFLSFLIALIVRDKTPPIQKKITKVGLTAQMRIIFKEKQTWLLSLYSGLAFAPVSVFGGLWGVSFIKQSYAMGNVEAAGAVSLIFIGFAIGCPISGWISDRMERRKPIMIAGTLIAFICLELILYVPLSTFMLQFLLFFFGLGASCFFLCFAMIREINPLVLAGSVLGFMNTFDSLWEAITEPFVGKLLDLSWSGALEGSVRIFSVYEYRLGLSSLSIYLILALGLLFFIKETFCKQKY